MRISRRLYRSINSPPVDLGDGSSPIRWIDLSLRIKDSIDRGVYDDSLALSRDEIVRLLRPPPARTRPAVIRSPNPFDAVDPDADPPYAAPTLGILRSEAVAAARAEDLSALRSVCAFGYAVLECEGQGDHDGRQREPVTRRIEELVRRVRVLVVENQELNDWIDHVELHRDRVERNLRASIRDLRMRLRELEGYVIALEAALYQSQIDANRIEPTVRSTDRATSFLSGVAENVVAGLILAGVPVGTASDQRSPVPPSVVVEISGACDAVIAALAPDNG